LTCETADIPDPQADEVLVRVTMAGVCGTDAHWLNGDLGSPRKALCFGHEGVGVIEVLGSEITHDHRGTPLAEGDRVYWLPCAPGVPCRECEACRANRGLSYCARFTFPISASIRPNGAGFQDFATVGPTAPLYRIPDETSTEAVIAFGCAMPTAVSAFSRFGDVTGAMVIQGCGPVGLACTVLAQAIKAEKIIVIGDSDDRRAAASRLGATTTVPVSGTTATEREEAVRSLTGGRGAEVVIEATGQAGAVPEGLNMLGIGGKYVIVGIYSGETQVSINPVQLNNRSLTMIGCLNDPVTTFPGALDAVTRYGERMRFADLISHRFPLEETEAAITAAGSGQAVKSVVVPGGSAL
jgi:5-exo-hydroxycamphor dehydrogenase